jgi:hypothetical protein
VVRRERLVWVTYAVLCWLLTWVDPRFVELAPDARVVYLVREALFYAVVVPLLARFGLLGVTGFCFAFVLTTALPLTFDPAVWYFPQAAAGVGVLVAVAGFCCWTAAGGKTLFPEGFFGDE